MPRPSKRKPANAAKAAPASPELAELDGLAELAELAELDGAADSAAPDIGRLRQRIVAALSQIVDDRAAPPAARAAAARTLAEMAGLIGRHSQPMAEPGQIATERASRAELLARLSAIRAELDR